MTEKILPAGEGTRVLRLSLIAGFAVLIGSGLCFLVARRESISRQEAASRRESVSALAAPGPVSWWPGDGDGNDIVGANNGIVPVSAKFADGMVGTAFSFEIVDPCQYRDTDNVRIPGFGRKLPTSEITVEFWQRVDSKRSQYSLLAGNAENILSVSAPWRDSKIYFEFGKSAGSLSYLPPVSIVGTWQHFACVASQTGNFMKIYRNGALEAQKIGMVPFANINCDLLLGRCIEGLLDEVKIYNRALSASEILAIYNASSGKTGEVR